MTKNKELKDKIDMIIKIVLIIIIILLLIHNCKLMKENNGYHNAPVPNGNVDIIEITCDGHKCTPVVTPTSKPSGPSGKDETPKKIENLRFAQESVSVKEGKTLSLVAIIKPSSLSGSKLTWKSSDSSVVSVDANGKIKGLKEGSATITVTSENGKIALCVVNVTKETIEVSNIVLNPSSMNLKVGDIDQISAIIEPENATERDIIWSSSDTSVVTVDDKGIVKAVKPGKATITVKTKDGKVVSTCTVEVKPVEVEEIKLSSNNVSLEIGSSKQLTAEVKPSNATDKEIVWSSSDTSIATVDSTGKITGVKNGTVTITAKSKDGKVVATCTVTVTKIPVDSISLNPSEMFVKVGSTSQIVATIEPENATDKEITWTSSDTTVAIVDSTGKVTGKKTGVVTITAKSKDGKVVATSTVTVTTDVVSIEEIILTPQEDTIVVGTDTQVIATIKPDNATERELVWSSSDTTVATVDSTGKVTGKKAGVVTITAKSKDGTVVATTTITVENDDVVVYDEDKDPVAWNGSSDLKIFSKSIYNVDGVIAPESANTYQFVVRNNTAYKVKYNISFTETNDYNINMKYKLKKNDTYIFNSYVKASDLIVSEYTLNSGESDTYYLDWKWISSSNDTSIGVNPEANYGLRIEVEAESINE